MRQVQDFYLTNKFKKKSLKLLAILFFIIPYHLSSQKFNSSNLINIAPSLNEDFELSSPGNYTNPSSILGWTLDCAKSSVSLGTCLTATNFVWNQPITEAWIRETPIYNVPHIGAIGHSPLGGTKILQLNDAVGGTTKTRARTSFSVTNSNNLFSMAYCLSLDGESHSCCEQPNIQINVYNCSGILQACLSSSIIATGPQCSSSSYNFTYTANTVWANWRVGQFDLSPYLNSCITIEVIASDCSVGGHHGTLYLDALCSQMYATPLQGTSITTPLPIEYCGSSNAILHAPSGYASYQWISPPPFFWIPPSNYSNSITVPNPFPNTSFTVVMTSHLGACQYSTVINIVPTQFAIHTIASSPSCIGGASGSATVITSSYGVSTTYTWVNSTNSVVGTASTVSNLAPGNYTVLAAKIGCGSATATVSVGSASRNFKQINQPFCSGSAFLNAPLAGSGYQWHAGYTPISGTLGGTSANYTVIPPLANNQYLLTYTTYQNCLDSLLFSLIQVAPGSISITHNKRICTGDTNGLIVVAINPSSAAFANVNSFWASNSSSGTATYSSTLIQSSIRTFTLANLSGSGNYSVLATDGVCTYSTSLTPSTTIFDFNISAGNPAICSSACRQVQIPISGSIPASQFTYTWSPSTFITGSANSFSICANLAMGTQSNITYTLAISPTVASACIETKTLTINIANANGASITAVPALCANSNMYTVQANPTGGAFYSSNPTLINANGIITPSNAIAGVNSFLYVYSVGSCSSTNTGTFLSLGPNLNINGPLNICSGQTITLSATGADMYLWSAGVTSNTILLNPISNTSYNLVGTNTLTGCSQTKFFVVNVKPTPTISLTGETEICEGNSATISVTGATQYLWSTGSQSANVVLSPTVSTNYTVQGFSDLNCSASKTLTLVVKNNPVLGVSNTQTICAGDQVALSVVGADKYLWNTQDTTNYILASPQTSYVYTVVGTIGECVSTQTVGLIVKKCTDLHFDEIQNQAELVFPNPGTGVFFLKLKSASAISVFNSLGQVAFESKTEKEFHTIDLSSFCDGIYTLNVFDLKVGRTIKLVKKQ